jgi:Zn-dependent protease with chaperone function
VQLIAFAVAASLATLLVLRYRERRAERAGAQLAAPEPAAVGERIS